MNGDPDPEGRPEIGDGPTPDEFDAIVSGWRREGQVPEWPADGKLPEEPPAASSPAPDPDGAAASLFEPTPPAVDEQEDEGHFVPPEPPPLPRIGPPAMVGLALLALGLVLVITPGWVGVPEPYGLPLGLLALASGLGWLVLRLWPDPPGDDWPADDDDDGAVL
jgi:hypothetical protein